MKRKIGKHLSEVPRDMWYFLTAISIIGFSQSILDSVFNNYLNDTFALSSLHRTMLEVPRELPGFLVVIVSAFLFFLCSRRLAVLATLLSGLGLILIGLFSSSFSLMLACLFVYSMGQHIFLPLNSSIGMDMAREGADGRRLGQLSGIRNLAAILGSFAVFVGFRYLHLNFTRSFLISACGFLCASFVLAFMKPDRPQHPKLRLRLYREYRLFYWLNVLYGTRKQIFLTFAPWVLVTVFKQPTQMLATLITIGGIIGIVLLPVLGRAIDGLGEKTILAAEAVILVFVCIGYGFSRTLFREGNTALIVTSVCFITDQFLIAVGMARATYLKKIALSPDHVSSTLSMGVSIDHLFSISIALLSGIIWAKFGYQYVFLCGAVIAVINFFSVLRIKIPKKHVPVPMSMEKD